MKVFIFTCIILIINAMTFGPFAAFGEEGGEEMKPADSAVLAKVGAKPTASADVGAFSKYVWRGFGLSEDSLVIQPSVTVEYRGFSMNLWGNLDTDNKVTEDSEFNETDLTVGYDTSIGDFDVGVGYIYYSLDAANDPEEIHASVCAAAIPLAPTLTIYRDITEIIGWYFNLGCSHTFELEKGITLDLAGSVGYYYSDDDAYVEVKKIGGIWVAATDKYRDFHDGQVSASLTIPIDKYVTLTPMIAYAFPLSGNADDLITSYSEGLGYSDNSDYFFGGVTVSIAF